MHELKIIQDIFPILENVAKENHLKSINKVFLKVGALRQVVPEFLQFAFATLAKDTLADSAELIIELVPITVACKTCQREFAVEENAYFCPHCESTIIKILTGKEIVLESVEGDAA
ncbi:MAG: Hydrogenase nickel insertion protein HypA [uncultured bacterium]|nr:MAG: Hydrogenase nickel insertion protein HypA [uncultured bacterium]